MTPHLTTRGRALLLAGAIFFAVGTVAGKTALLFVGEVTFAMVALSYLLAILRLWSVENGELRLELSLDDRARHDGVHRGEEVTFDLCVENASRRAYARLAFEPMAPSGLRFGPDTVRMGFLLAQTRSTLPLRARAARTGRWVVHGVFVGAEDLLGMVRVSTYVATPASIRVLPARSMLTDARVPAPRKRALLATIGEHRARRLGEGYELREIREYVAGDPFNKIAWKATARHRRPMVRQYELELVVETTLVLDVSSTMRGGTDGAKFEHALELSHQLMHALSVQHDRLGLVTADDRVLGAFRPDGSSLHYRRLLDHLVGLNHVVDPELTEYGEHEVLTAVVNYLLVQERLDFRAQPGGAMWATYPDDDAFNTELLERWLRSRVGDEADNFHGELPARSASPDLDELARLFAVLRGIEIPYRVETRVGAKEHGLAAAITEAASMSRDAMFIVVLTDLCGMIDVEPLLAAVDLARSRRHSVVFAVPFTPAYVDVPKDDKDVQHVLHDVFSIAERRDRKRIIDKIRARGCRVISMGPDTPLAEMLAALEPLRRAV